MYHSTSPFHKIRRRLWLALCQLPCYWLELPMTVIATGALTFGWCNVNGFQDVSSADVLGLTPLMANILSVADRYSQLRSNTLIFFGGFRFLSGVSRWLLGRLGVEFGVEVTDEFGVARRLTMADWRLATWRRSR
jgi:hypothetical protein